MVNPHEIGPDRAPYRSGSYRYSWDSDFTRDWATALALILLLVGGLALLIYSSDSQRTAAIDDVTTGQSTRPAPTQPLIPLPQHP